MTLQEGQKVHGRRGPADVRVPEVEAVKKKAIQAFAVWLSERANPVGPVGTGQAAGNEALFTKVTGYISNQLEVEGDALPIIDRMELSNAMKPWDDDDTFPPEQDGGQGGGV